VRILLTTDDGVNASGLSIVDSMAGTPGLATDLEGTSEGRVTVPPLHLELAQEPSLARLAELYD
jgi:broad specificity polyphosphatase/5'/3'-nucleotidase SurE